MPTTCARPPARHLDTPPRFGAVTVHRPGRRRARRALALAVVVVAATVSLAVVRWIGDDSRRAFLATDGWPAQGQGAYVLDGGAVHASPAQTSSPIASLAKVMTAYLVLHSAPLSADRAGFVLHVTRADVADTAARRTRDESVVAVRAGERLTERQALMALMLPSANNVAVLIARRVAGSVPAFVHRMNAAALRLGMWHTVYTDPSGYDERTVSTAADQLILAREVAAEPTLAAIAATRSYRLPVAGTVHNTDVLLGHDGFVGLKTGSDDAAGGCFMFHARRGGHDLVGVVLGQPGRNLTRTGQYAARQLAVRVLPA